MSKFKDQNVDFFHESMLVAADDFEAFKEMVQSLEPEDLAEVTEMYQNSLKYLLKGRVQQYWLDIVRIIKSS